MPEQVNKARVVLGAIWGDEGKGKVGVSSVFSSRPSPLSLSTTPSSPCLFRRKRRAGGERGELHSLARSQASLVCVVGRASTKARARVKSTTTTTTKADGALPASLLARLASFSPPLPPPPPPARRHPRRRSRRLRPIRRRQQRRSHHRRRQGEARRYERGRKVRLPLAPFG